MPARSALTWVITSQNSSSTFSFDRPTTSIFGTPATFRCITLGSGSASPVHHSWRMAKEATGGDQSQDLHPIMTMREITMEIVSLLWIYSRVTSNRCFHTEPHQTGEPL